jgi:hypothetical protein
MLLCAVWGCNQQRTDQHPTTILLTYNQQDIQKSFDTLYNYQKNDSGWYCGLSEQALAICHEKRGKDPVTQDVFSSMYLNNTTGEYDCVTTTTFQFPDGSIVASGIFNLVPGSQIAPDHDFPVTGGSGKYRNTYGTYTRHYLNGVYHVKLQLHKWQDSQH